MDTDTPPPVEERVKKKIFDNQLVEQLLVEFRRTNDFATYQRVCMESMNLIDSIIRGNKFYKQAPFHEIRNYIFTQFHKWCENWHPDKARLYSYLSVCIKNGCISYVTKESAGKKRHVFTDVPLDTVGLAEDVSYSHHHLSDDDLATIQASILSVVARWKEPVIRECLRYMVTVALQRRISRRHEVLQSAVWGYNIPLDTAKFLFDWSLGSVRGAMLEHWDSPLGEADIIRAAEKFSFIPDMANLVGWKNVRKLLTVYQGMTVKFPTVSTLRRAFAVREIYNQGAIVPHKMEKVGKSFGISPSKIGEVFEEVSANMQAGVMEDDPLFESSPADAAADSAVEVPYFMQEFGGTPDDFDHPSYGD